MVPSDGTKFGPTNSDPNSCTAYSGLLFGTYYTGMRYAVAPRATCIKKPGTPFFLLSVAVDILPLIFLPVVIRRQIISNNFETVHSIDYNLTCPNGLTILTCSCYNPAAQCPWIGWVKRESLCTFRVGILNLTGATFQANALCGIGIPLSYFKSHTTDTGFPYFQS